MRVTDRPGPPPLRFESADGGRLLLRQGDRPLLLGRDDPEGCSREGLYTHRLDGYRSPLPPIRSARMREPGNWPHQYARWLEDSTDGPLYDGRWILSERRTFPLYVWTGDFVRDWPAHYLDWCAGGWQGVIPLRPLSAPDAARVKAYRGHAREGTLAPVLLWWVPFLDGWLILDGHDRAVAALAEGGTPPCVVLERGQDDRVWRETADVVTARHREHLRSLDAHPSDPGTERRRTFLERSHAELLASLPYDHGSPRSWPLPGGAVTWDDLAARVMFQCGSD